MGFIHTFIKAKYAKTLYPNLVLELIPSPKRYFINSYRVDYVPNSLEPQERSGYEKKSSNQR